MTTKRNKAALTALLLLLGYTTMAQQFGWHSPLGAITANGFYRISILPPLSAISNADFSDLRIKDNATGQFVPYILRKESTVTREDVFNQFRLADNTTSGKYTTIVAEGPPQQPITALALTIRNTAADRVASLSGSDDNNKWYTIDDAVQLHRSYSSRENTYTETITFPTSNYKYYRLKVDNGKADPLNIVQIGTYTSIQKGVPAAYHINPTPALQQKDSSDHKSYIAITTPQPYLTARLTLDVNAPRYYKRDAWLYILPDTTNPNMDNSPVASFTITTGIQAIVSIPPQKAKRMLVVIDNKDNPPLKVTQVTTAQEKQCIVAWLEPGKQYDLLTGSTHATTPDYDLAHFRDSIPADIKELTYARLEPNPQPIATPNKPTNNNNWLWPTIIFAVIAMSFLTFRLMRDMKKGEG